MPLEQSSRPSSKEETAINEPTRQVNNAKMRKSQQSPSHLIEQHSHISIVPASESNQRTISSPHHPTILQDSPKMNQHLPPVAVTRYHSSIIVAKLTSVLLTYFILQGPRGVAPPHLGPQLLALRTQLLQDSFFDLAHHPEELSSCTRAAPLPYWDLIVLFVRLMKVLMRSSPLSEEDRVERIAVRTQCLSQPFFNRTMQNMTRPFSGDAVDDEGISMG